jgi:hypothetical protein
VKLIRLPRLSACAGSLGRGRSPRDGEVAWSPNEVSDRARPDRVGTPLDSGNRENAQLRTRSTRAIAPATKRPSHQGVQT